MGINLVIPDKSHIAIVGDEFSGKTAILKSLAFALDITYGEILFNGKDIMKMNKKEKKNYLLQMGFISTYPALIQDISPYENLKNYLRGYKSKFHSFFGLLSKKQEQQIIDAFTELDILKYSFAKTETLSPTSQKRVEIAKFLVSDIKIILADDPTNYLDNRYSEKIVEIIIKEAKKQGATLLFVSHDMKLVKKYFKNVYKIDQQSKTVELKIKPKT
ncbi:ATP-binding cassette domain-containing protein [Mycoplasmopsis pulmonis]|uniref:ATP-binding cassette domain-containing protein n=1 Tax=Mycoplasmopsis pulmonis TaxID=2107 RepID=UPI00100510F0|nr:ATP-binding cassette domain-containing protein [Mycoplasmopsis pulmonis]MDZ7293078.1 ATP-binding cassette domain-containing protein [Mycoplasmopsis pulmonis]VEU67871.1 ABC transporter ATP-binding protein [Mycoplasmopsis pulmonis]